MQYHKVELCGINTATLTTLSEEEKTTLLMEAHQGNQEARDLLIRGNLRLVLSIIHRFSNRGEAMDDLFQIGCIGLMKAIDGFDVTLGVKFSTYGVPMILGELRRYLRDNNSIRVSRSLKDIAYRTMQEKERFTTQNGREPTVSEIAEQLHLDRTDVIQALEAIVEPISLYEPIYEEGGDPIYVLDQLGDREDDRNWLEELALKEAVQGLADREKHILFLRFLQGYTQIQVAHTIGISQAQVSRLEKSALKKIKQAL